MQLIVLTLRPEERRKKIAGESQLVGEEGSLPSARLPPGDHIENFAHYLFTEAVKITKDLKRGLLKQALSLAACPGDQDAVRKEGGTAASPLVPQGAKPRALHLAWGQRGVRQTRKARVYAVLASGCKVLHWNHRTPTEASENKQASQKCKFKFQSGQKVVTFIASNGWLDRFKKRYDLYEKKWLAEEADCEAAAAYPGYLKKLSEENAYLPQQIFSADATPVLEAHACMHIYCEG
ncbi:Tigger Transposable Element-Derived Protein 2 [Manis pentadactyla]|nr:Tigger Transposable Element-Derived Protein 2 [Manis pentadactyla]